MEGVQGGRSKSWYQFLEMPNSGCVHALLMQALLGRTDHLRTMSGSHTDTDHFWCAGMLGIGSRDVYSTVQICSEEVCDPLLCMYDKDL